MQLVITNGKRISNIQEEFNKFFPFLKIEFFSVPHRKGEGSAKSHLIDSSKTIKEASRTHHEGSITLTQEMTTAELENQFEQTFGLHIQVFRKSGKVWLETTLTDTWTLAEQNEQGWLLNQPV